MKDQPINEKESLEIISRMIQNTQNKITGGEGISMLVWSYVTVSVTIAVWTLITITGRDIWNFLWFAIPVLGIPLNFLFGKKHKVGVRTFIDKVITFVWLVLGIGCFLFSAISFIVPTPVLPVVLLLVGSGSVITGLVIKFKAVTIGGSVAMILSFVLLLMGNTQYYALIFALSFVAMGVIPGHVLNHKAKKLCSKN